VRGTPQLRMRAGGSEMLSAHASITSGMRVVEHDRSHSCCGGKLLHTKDASESKATGKSVERTNRIGQWDTVNSYSDIVNTSQI
jgi:hypothetical protein